MQFLEFVNYFKIIITNYLEIIHPLVELTKNIINSDGLKKGEWI